jgi:hypothetical protein
MSEVLTDAESTALAALGYSEEWLTSGLLDRRLLEAQYQRLRAGGTHKTGQYRSKAVTAWLAGAGAIDATQLDAFLALMSADPDPKMARTAIAELIQSPRIDLEQLGRIALSDPKLMRSHEPLIRRTYLTRRMNDEITDELIAQVIELQDASIQTRLVRDVRLARKHAELLAKRGANPTIRANAQAWFQDKSFWR